ncbi:MAG: NAD-dependent epimerase/dehydratase family protein [Bacteroidales bacterium]|nr:NAD-dependent epimerase/dehydratase family protein [Bacteroidales bacterium]
MKVLLIGATGLLGHQVLRLMEERGMEVVATCRREGGIRLPAGRWRQVVGSPLDYQVLLQASEGCEAVVNCAGEARMDLLRAEEYSEANVELPKQIVRVMEERGIRRLVHVSTVNTIGYGTSERPAAEEAPMEEPFSSSLYAQSKREGERVVVEAARRHADWHAVVVCPGFMLGAYDVKPSSGRMLLAAYRRRVMLAPRGGKAFVAVEDVAEAVVNALERGENGKRYIVANASGCMSIKDLYQLQAQRMGYRQRVGLLPGCLVSVAGRVGDGLRWLGVRTELSTVNVRQLMVSEHYDGRLGASCLGFGETPIGDAIESFHRWREENNIK